MPEKDYDVLNILNANIQNNNYNEGSNADDELKILNDNTQELNKTIQNFTGPKLTDEEEAAKQAGIQDAELGVIHSDPDDIINFQKQQRILRSNNISDGEETYSPEKNNLTVSSETGDINTLVPGKPSLNDNIKSGLLSANGADDAAMSTDALYRSLLGMTAYEKLKYACGLGIGDSYTDYYNRTHYVPRGFEMEAKLLLAEEKRMKLYAQVMNDEMSETDFLYQAYGKDILKEQGYDLSSKIFWYNRYKKGQYDNPLDNVVLLENIINYAATMFTAEKWYEKATSKTSLTSLEGIVTGTTLSDEKVYSIYKDQIDAFKPYFDDDINKVIVAYQAGNLNGAFNPLVDIDGDGKYDYYYHVNGKMYAIEGSSGTGSAIARIEYNDDGSPHMVEINEGLTGELGGFFEGLAGFFGTFLDLVSMIDSVIPVPFMSVSGTVDLFKGRAFDWSDRTYWVDNQQEWNAFKNKIFSNNDVQIFDNDHEWGYEISKGVGTITGQIILQVILALLTYGAGNAAVAGGTIASEAGATAASEAGAQAASSFAVQVGSSVASAAGKAALMGIAGATVGAGVGATIEGVTLKEGETFDWGKVGSGAITGFTAGFGIGLATGVSASTQFIKDANGTITTVSDILQQSNNLSGFSGVMTKSVLGFSRLTQFVTKGNSGAMFTTTRLAGRLGNAALLAAKDIGNTVYNLYSANRLLKYYEDNTDADIHSLSDAEIWLRAGITALTDIAISTSMRLQGENGITAFGKQVKGLLTNDYGKIGEETITRAMWKSMDDVTRQAILSSTGSMAKTMFEVGLDNTFDIVENMITMGVTGAMSNPYAKLGSEESLQTMLKTAFSPQAIIQNLYITFRNTVDFKGNASTFSQRQVSTFFNTVPSVVQKATMSLDKLILSAKTVEQAEAFRAVKQEFMIKLGYTDPTQSSEMMSNGPFGAEGVQDKNFYQNAINALNWLGNAVINPEEMDPEYRKVFLDGVGMTEKKYKTMIKRRMAIKNQKDVKKFDEKHPEFWNSIFWNMIDNEVRNKNNQILLKVAEETFNSYAKIYESESWFFKTAFKKGVQSAITENSKTRTTVRKIWQNFLNKANDSVKDMAFRTFLNNMNTDSIFENKKTHIISDTILNSSTKIIEEDADLEIATVLSLFKNTKTHASLVDDEKGDAKFKFDTGFIEELSPAQKRQIPALLKIINSADAMKLLASVGAIKINENGDGYDLEFTERPFLVLSQKDERHNDILKDASRSAYWKAVNDFCILSMTKDEKGEWLINSDTPLGVKITLPNETDAGVGTKDYYVILTAPGMNDATIAQRFDSANKIIACLYGLRYGTNTQEEINNYLATLGYYNLFGAIDGTIDPTKNITDLTENELRLARLTGISTLLQITDVKSDPKYADGFSRTLLLKLVSLNASGRAAIHMDDIEEIIASYENKTGTITKKAYDSAKAIKQYFDLADKIQPALDVLYAYTQNAERKITTTVGPIKGKKLDDFLAEISKPENEWLKTALLEDDRINNQLLKMLIEHPDGRLPFSGGLEVLGAALAHSISAPEFSKDSDQRVVNQIVRLINSYNDSNRFSENSSAIIPLIKESLRRQISLNYGEFRESRALVDEAFRTRKEIYETSFDLIKDDIYKTFKTYNSFTKDILKGIETAKNFSELLDYIYGTETWDAKGNNQDFEDASNKLKEIVATDEFKAFKKDAESIFGEKINTNSIRDIWNMVSSRFNKVNNDDPINDTVREFHTDWSEFHDDAAQYYGQISDIANHHRTLIYIADFVKSELEKISPELKLVSNNVKDTLAYRSLTKEFADDFKYITYRDMLDLTDEQFDDFFKNPLRYLQTLKKVWSAIATEEQQEAVGLVFDDLIKSIGSKNDMLVFTMKNLVNAETVDLDLIYKQLSSEEQSPLKKYISYCVFLTDPDTTLKEMSSGLKFEQAPDGTILYKGKHIMDYLVAPRNNAVSIAKMLQHDLDIYQQYAYVDTTRIESPDVIEVNTLDLIPNNMAKVLRLLSVSEDLVNKFKDAVKENNNEALNEINDILNSQGYGNLFDYQLKEYIDFVNSHKSSSFIFSIDIHDKDTTRLDQFKRQLQFLGYTQSDFLDAESKSKNIPGVYFKTSSSRGIKTNIDFNKMISFLNNLGRLTIVNYESADKQKKSARYILNNMFRSVYALNDDSTIDLSSESGDFVKLYGRFNDLSSDIIATALGGSQSRVEPFKKGLSAGAGAGFNVINNAAFEFSKKDQKSINTYNVIKIIENVKEYFTDKKHPHKIINLQYEVGNEEIAKELIAERIKFEQAHTDKSGNKHFLYSVKEAYEKENEKYLVVFTPNFKQGDEIDTSLLIPQDEKFDIRTIVPTGAMRFHGESMQSFIEKLIGTNKLDGIKNLDDLNKLVLDKPIIYSLNESEYNKFIKKRLNNGVFTVTQFKEVFNSTTNKQKNNYYIAALYNYIASAEAYNTHASSKTMSLNGIDVSMLRDATVRNIISNFLISDKYASLLDNVDESLIKELVKEVMPKINDNAERIAAEDTLRDNFRYFSDDINSSSMSKLHISSNLNFKAEDLEKALTQLLSLYTFKQAFYYNNDNDFELPKANPYVTLLNLIDYDNEGKAVFNLDYFLRTQGDELNKLVDLLNNPNDILKSILSNEDISMFKKELGNLLVKVESKKDLLEQMDSYKERNTYATVARHEPTYLNAPTIEIRNFALTHGINDEATVNYLSKLAEGRILAKGSYSKFLTASSLYDEGDEFTPFKKFYVDLIDDTLAQVVDKAGHSLVYNMNSAEARGAFLSSILDFANLLDENNVFDFSKLKLSDNQKMQLLTKIALLSNAYSTGTTIASEYSGALMITLDNETDIKFDDDEINFDQILDIKPVVVSTSDPTKSIYTSLLFGDKTLDDIAKETTKQHILITLNKNTFTNNTIGYDDGASYLNLNDPKVRSEIFRDMVYKMDNAIIKKEFSPIGKTREDILLEYYKPQPTVYNRVQRMKEIARTAGIPEAVVKELGVSFNRINVRNDTNISEEQFNSYVMGFISNSSLTLNNEERQTMEDIFLHGVTYNALSEQGKQVIEDFKSSLIDDDNVFDVAKLLNEDLSEGVKKLDILSEDQQVKAVKLFTLLRGNGSDLEYILNQSSVPEYRAKLKEAIDAVDNNNTVLEYNPETDSYEFSTWKTKDADHPEKTPYNALDYGNAVFSDSEWLGKKNDNVIDGFYQDGFIVVKHTNIGYEFKKYNILIEKAFSISSKQKDIASDDDIFYVESAESFKAKSDLITEAKKQNKLINIGGINCLKIEDSALDAITYVVVDKKQAIDLYEQILAQNNVKTIFGFNNKGEGSDNSWLLSEESGRRILDSIDCIDVQNDILNGAHFDDDQINAVARTALDYLRNAKTDEYEWWITKRDRTVHDAVNDSIDTFFLYQFLSSHRRSVNNLFDAEYQSLFDAGIKEEILNKALDFSKDIDFKLFTNKSDIDILNSFKDKTKKAIVLKQLLNTYQNIENVRTKRVYTKEINKNLRTFIFGDALYGNQARKMWGENVLDFSRRSAFTSVLYNSVKTITNKIGLSLEDVLLSHNRFTSTYKDHVMDVLDSAVRTFRDSNSSIISDYAAKNNLDYVNAETVTQLFFTLDESDVNMYLNSAMRKLGYTTGKENINFFEKAPTDFLSRTFDVPDPADRTKTIKKNIVDSLLTDDVANTSVTSAGYARDNAINKFNSVFSDFTGAFDQTTLFSDAPDFAQTLINNMISMLGKYSDVEIDRVHEKSKELISFTNGFDSNMRQFIKDSFSTEDGLFYSVKALYSMASEKQEFIKESGDFGVVTIGKETIEKAYPELKGNYNVGDTFYSTMWRQPGQGRTMHIMKFKIVDGNELSITRSTALSYFNGDLDGDHYMIAKPNNSLQKFGEAFGKYTTAGADAILSGFKNIEVKGSDYKAVNDACNNAIEKMKTSLNDIIAKYKASNYEVTSEIIDLLSKAKELFINTVNPELGDDTTDFWNYYGIQLNRINGKLYLTINNKALFNSQSDDVKDAFRRNQNILLHTNHFTSQYDSQLIGGLSKLKKYNLSEMSDDFVDNVFTPDLIMSSATMKQLNSELKTMSTKEIVKMLTQSIKFNDLVVNSLKSEKVIDARGNSTNAYDFIINNIKSVKSFSASDLLYLAQLIQSHINESADYKSILSEQMKTNLDEYAKPYREKAALIENYFDKQNTSFKMNTSFTKKTDEEINSMSGPQLMMHVAGRLDDMLKYYSTNNGAYVSVYRNNAARNLFGKMISDGSLDIKHTRTTEIIAPNGTTSLHPASSDKVDYERIGLAPMKVMVRTGDQTTTDSFQITDKCRLQDMFVTAASLKNAKSEALDRIYSSEKMRGSEILKYFNLKSINPNATYIVDVNDKTNIVHFRTSTSLVDLAKGGYIKTAFNGAKMGKGTVMASIYDSSKLVGEIIPDAIMTEELFNINKSSYSLGSKKIGTVKENGIEYEVYEVDGAAIVDSWQRTKPNVKFRNEDTISVLMGLQGSDAFLTLGTMAYEIENGQVKFNPEGITKIQDTLKQYNLPEYEDVNSIAEINMLKISSILTSVSEETRDKMLSKLGLPLDLDKALMKLYTAVDIGGYFGTSKIDELENILFDSNESDKQAVFKAIKDIPLYRTVWSTSLRSAVNKTQVTDADVSYEDYFYSKNTPAMASPRVADITKTNVAEARKIAASNGVIDYNTGFYGKVQLYEDLTGKKLGISKLLSLYDAGLIDYLTLERGSEANDFHGILDRQGIKLDRSDYPELGFAYDLKTGGTGEVGTRFNNNQPDSIYLQSYQSKGYQDFDTRNYYGESLEGHKGMNDAYKYHIHKYLMPFLSNGKLEDIAMKMTNNKLQAEGSVVRGNLVPSEYGLKFGTTYKAQEKQSINKFASAVKDELKLPQESKLYNERLESAKYKIESAKDTIDALTGIENYLNKPADNIDNQILKVLRKYKSTFDAGDFVNEDFKGMDYWLDQQLTEEDYISAVKLWTNKNGTDLQTSGFNSWGFKAENNKDIGLGQKTLYLHNAINSYMNKFLGKDLKVIVYAIKENKAYGNVINKYIDIKYKLDMYDNLIKNQKEHIKDLGKYKYDEAVAQVQKNLIGTESKVPFDTALAEIRSKLKSIESNELTGALLIAINNINNRLIGQAQADNPYALCGYYMPMYDSDSKKNLNWVPQYINAYNTKTENTREVLNGYRKNFDGSVEYAQALYNTEDGYLGMVMKVAQQYAVKNALADLSKYLKSEGWMSNSELFVFAHSALKENILDKFTDSFSNFTSEKRREYDEFTYQVIRDSYNSAMLQNTPIRNTYTEPQDFIDLFEAIQDDYFTMMNKLGISSKTELISKLKSVESVSTNQQYNKEEIAQAAKLSDVYENSIAIMINIWQDNNPKEANEFLNSLYNTVIGDFMKNHQDYVLVDSRGAMLNKDGDPRFPSYTTFDMDDILMDVRLNHSGNREAEIARQILLGDVYLMKKSVAEQLDSKVFTKRIPGVLGQAFNKTRGYVTSLIMANPVQLADRLINFTLFDAGALLSADPKALDYVQPTIATIIRYKDNIDSITPQAIAQDKGLEILLRYMAASGQSPYKVTNLMGEPTVEINIPVVKQFMAVASNALANQQFFVRMAYFWDLVENTVTSKNGKEWLDPLRFGVAFHKQDGLETIEANNQNSDVYNSFFNMKEAKFYNWDNENDRQYIQNKMNMDAAALQIVAENVGVFGNMPYASKVASRLGFMFTGFPLAAMRWGSNRFQSLAYAFTHFGKENRGGTYLMRNLGSSALVSAVLLALQVIASPSTQKYLKKKTEGNEDELTDEEKQNAENILFRGGCVRLFDSWLKKEEQTNAGHSRDPLLYLFNSFVADFVLKDEDEKFIDVLGNVFKSNVLSHVNPIIKDPIESIPGNTALQSTSWYTPSDNFLENIGRKAAGYVIGSAQANAFWDSMKSQYNAKEGDFLSKVATGLQHAYIDNLSGIQEYKSNWRNYKKAFSIIYDYLELSGQEYQSDTTNTDTKYYKTLKEKLSLALKTKTSASGFYSIIKDALDSGVPLKTVKSAVQNCSIRQKLLKIGDINNLQYTLSDSELAVIKTALAYEDYMFPYLTTYFENLQDEYWKENYKHRKVSSSAISSELYNAFNTPTRYSSSYNTNYKKFNNAKKFLITSQNNYKKYSSMHNPLDTFNNMLNTQAYGTSKDIWGNETRHYTDGSTYKVRQPGMSIFGNE